MSPANKNKAASAAPQGSGLGLDAIGDLSGLLSAPVVHAAAGNDRPRMFDVSTIHEDDHQPRRPDNPGFYPESIAELASSIDPVKGIKSPISLREHPDLPGHFLINHGARRYRATVSKGLTHIPGFVDNDYSEADQVIENLQRNELTAREIADFIGRELAKGKKKQDIAASIGKSNAFVSQHVTLLDLPDAIATAFNNGRVRDVTVINDLAKLFKKDEAAVTEWLEDESIDITRASVGLLREFMESKGGQATPTDKAGSSEDKTASDAGDDPPPAKKGPPDPSKIKKAIVQVRHNDRPARLLLDRRPTEVGLAWLKYDEDGQEIEADIGTAQLVAIMEA
jgi:ParB family chromosome partitioning protein